MKVVDRLLGLVHRREQVADARARLEQARARRAKAQDQARWAEGTYARNGFAEQVDLSLKPQPPARGERGPEHP